MGKKYIIELEDKPFHKGNGDFLYRVKGFNSLVFDMNGVGKLTPYTKPDLKVRKEAYDKGYTDAAYNCHERCAFLDDAKKEAYQRGYETAKHECEDCPKQAYTDTLRMESYQKGLSDAWEAARKICLAESEGGFSGKTLCYIFDTEYYRDALKDYTPAKAIEKIRLYEQEKEEQIQVGDEVVGTYTGGEETEPFVIIRKIPEIDPTYYFGIYSKSGEFCQGGLKLKKTGRHFPEIAEVLQKMKESHDNK